MPSKLLVSFGDCGHVDARFVDTSSISSLNQVAHAQYLTQRNSIIFRQSHGH